MCISLYFVNQFYKRKYSEQENYSQAKKHILSNEIIKFV